jgi:diketogulonate reductase-like aldo/keto reductase
MKTVALPGGQAVPALGQGTWYMGERRADGTREADALRLGIDLGMMLIDTAEMYANGGSETVVGDAIAGQRDRVFLVSKVLPSNASRTGTVKACEASLKRLRTDRIDLYLLHWQGSYPMADTVAAFESLKVSGKIRYWGVSNFDLADIRALPPDCAANQVLYHPNSRGIEYDLLPWCIQHGMPVMAYSPLGHDVRRLLASPALKSVAARHGATPAQVAIAWGLRHPNVISIPKAASAEHVRENAGAASLVLTAEDLAAIDAAHRPPTRKAPLDLL